MYKFAIINLLTRYFQLAATKYNWSDNFIFIYSKALYISVKNKKDNWFEEDKIKLS